MSLDAAHLEYPLRRHGMDHDRYDWSMLQQRPALKWPEAKPLAVWINVSLQHFPLNPSAAVKLPGVTLFSQPQIVWQVSPVNSTGPSVVRAR